MYIYIHILYQKTIYLCTLLLVSLLLPKIMQVNKPWKMTLVEDRQTTDYRLSFWLIMSVSVIVIVIVIAIDAVCYRYSYANAKGCRIFNSK